MSASLHCHADGIPNPKLLWLKNGLELQPRSSKQLSLIGEGAGEAGGGGSRCILYKGSIVMFLLLSVIWIALLRSHPQWPSEARKSRE